jgi:predicted SAM-dependent methyltransferase
MADEPVYVNIGCGTTFHPAWRNFDLVSTSPQVIACDVRFGLPLGDGTADAVYHSHVLEHLRREEVQPFLAECRRVLAPGGLLRIAVPDLEGITRTYLDRLEAALRDEPGAADDYDWMMLELYDQTVREQPGGGMRAFLSSAELRNQDFIRQRIGREADGLLAPSAAAARARQPLTPSRVARAVGRRLVSSARAPLQNTSRGHALALGRMRLSGEVHQWMYDRYSLARLLVRCGFSDPTVTTAHTSMIPGWVDYGLDVDEHGAVRKPDSLFMEARRPAAQASGTP